VIEHSAKNISRNSKTHHGMPVQPQLQGVMSAWDEMLVAKTFPGRYNVPYVAGMNVTSLPTNTFAVSQAIQEARQISNSTDQPLGTHPYTLIMWCPAATAFFGAGADGQIPATSKLGGFFIA
jgi:hypothetical protein